MDPIHSVGIGSRNSPHISDGTTGKEERRLRETAQELEGVFLGMMMKAMRSTVASGGLFGGTGDNQTYREMFDSEIARGMARAGGIGLAELVVRDRLLRQTPAKPSLDSEVKETREAVVKE